MQQGYKSESAKVFDFVDMPSFAFLFIGNLAEPLFAKVTKKGAKEIKDPYGYFFYVGQLNFKGNYLKLTKSWNLNHKKIQTLPISVLFPPDKIYDTHIDTDDNFLLNAKIYITLVAKAHA